ncbi:MAG: hypothetical protein IJY77_00595 [Alphaproteobacteria bacterium]|nr:hypothetical protein [Alphaproteobacteria bacterium]
MFWLLPALDAYTPLSSRRRSRGNPINNEYMKQWIPACAGMTVLKEINIKHRRHPRAGGDPLRSGCSLRLNDKNYDSMKQWIPACAGMMNK